MAGVERNPGPRNEGNCKGHDLRAKVEKNLAEKINSPYVPNHVRDKKVFKVSVGPEIQTLSFKDIEATFVKGKEWANMRTNIWTVPTAIIKKRLKSHETLLDIEKEICKEFENKKEIEKSKLNRQEKIRFENEETKKMMEATIKYINNEKQRHSKTKNLDFKKVKCRTYLKDKRLNSNEIKLLFQLRSRMYPVKCNFKNKFLDDLNCDLCRMNNDNQEHLLNCKVLKNAKPEIFQNSKVEYNHIFEDTDNQIEAAKLFYKVSTLREKLLEAIGKPIFEKK